MADIASPTDAKSEKTDALNKLKAQRQKKANVPSFHPILVDKCIYPV